MHCTMSICLSVPQRLVINNIRRMKFVFDENVLQDACNCVTCCVLNQKVRVQCHKTWKLAHTKCSVSGRADA